MTFEQYIWAAVFANECTARQLAQGGYDVGAAVKAADHAVTDLARYRETHPAPAVISGTNTNGAKVAKR